MKYKCPHCENELVVHWYDAKPNVRCSQCENLVFAKHLRKLRILFGSASGLACFLGITISRGLNFNIGGLILAYVAMLSIIISFLRIVERDICKDLRVR